MDLKIIDDAIALLEEGNLTRAAARRNVTQPAFSRRIRALEEWIGVPLLERGSNRVTLIPGFSENAAEFRAILARIEQFRESIASSHPAHRTVVVAAQHALSVSAFPRVLARCSGPEPSLVWSLRTLNREDCIAMFLRGSVDLMFCYESRGFPPLPFDNSIVRRKWMSDTLLPVVGGPYRYQVDADGALPEEVPMIIYSPSSHFGRLMALRGIGPTADGGSSRTLLDTDFSVGVLEMVRNGAGVGWVPYSMCREDLGLGTLISLHKHYGSIPLDATLFAAADNTLALRLIDTATVPGAARASSDPNAGDERPG